MRACAHLHARMCTLACVHVHTFMRAYAHLHVQVVRSKLVEATKAEYERQAASEAEGDLSWLAITQGLGRGECAAARGFEARQLDFTAASRQVRSGRVGSGQVKSSQVKSSQVKSGHRPSLGQVGSGGDRWGQVR